MYINLVLIPFVIVLGLLLSVNDNKRNRGIYIIFCSLVFLVIGSLRNPEWMTSQYGLDTAKYKDLFEFFSEVRWQECWEMAVNRYKYGGEDDIGFVALNKLISLVTNDFSIYSILTGLIFFIPFSLMLHRFSTSMRQLIFAYVFYVVLIQVFIFGAARQMISIGLDIMALLLVVDRKKWIALIFFLIGVTIHFSSLIFLIPLLMVWLNIKPRPLKLTHILCFIMFPVVLAFPNQIIVFMGESVGVEKYANYGVGDVSGRVSTFVVLIELLSVLCLIAIKKKDLLNIPHLSNIYVMAPFFTLMAPLLMADGAMIRVSLYYHLFLTLLVPYSLDCLFKTKDNWIAYVLAIGFFIALSGKGMEYYFFWQYQS